MKRGLIWLIVLFMMIAASYAVHAEEGVPEVPPAESQPTVGYKGGFFIRNDDGSFELKIKGRMQPKLYYEKQSGQKGMWSARLRRARIDFAATVAEKAKFSLSLQHSTSSAKYQTMNVSNATLAYEFDPVFVLTAGTVGMPLSIIGATSSLGYFMLEPPLVLTQSDGGTITPLRSDFGNPDGLGVQASGEFSKFYYELSVVNGAARTNAAAGTGGVESNYDLNLDSKVSMGARVGWNILEAAADGMEPDLGYSEKAKWTINAGGMYQGKRQDPATLAVVNKILTGSLGTAFKWRGFSVLTEAFGRKTTLKDRGTALWFSNTMDDFGYYVDSGYFIIPKKLEAAITGSQIFREGPSNNSYQMGGGLNWYLSGNNLKLQLGYLLTVGYLDQSGSKTNKTHHIGTMLTASF